MNGDEPEYMNWAAGEPDGEKYNLHCVAMNLYESLGSWMDYSCSSYQRYICKVLKRELSRLPRSHVTSQFVEGKFDPDLHVIYILRSLKL